MADKWLNGIIAGARVLVENTIAGAEPSHRLVNALEESDAALVGHTFVVAKQIAAREGLAGDGYRLTVNIGAQGGQIVFHMHLHLIGGRQMRAMG